MNKRILLILLFLIFTDPYILFSETIASLRRPTAVIGFISKIKDDPAAGDWFTRITIREMQKIPVIRTPSAEEVRLVMDKLGLTLDSVNLEKASIIASNMNCSQFIMGELLTEESSGKVKVRFQLYDARDREVLVEDSVVVSGGAGLYDALDKFQKEIVGSLFDASTLPAKLGLGITTGKAWVSVNDGELREVEKNSGIWLRFKPGTKLKIKYYDYFNKILLLSTNIILLPDAEVSFEYRPSARLHIEGLPGARIRKSDGSMLNVPTNGRMETEINASIKEPLVIETREKKINIELNTKINSDLNISSTEVRDPRKIDYSLSLPLMSYLIPGFAQYQANDVFLGSFFSLLALGGAGLSAFGFFAQSQMLFKSAETDIPEDIRKFQIFGELYGTMGYIGAGLWVISAIVSGSYAYWHPTRFIDSQLREKPVSFYMDSKSCGIQFSFLFS